MLAVAKQVARCCSLRLYHGDGCLSGDFATDMTTHSIRDGPDTHRVDDSERILVEGTYESDLAPTDADPGAHRE
jgi:hypothetical protein